MLLPGRYREIQTYPAVCLFLAAGRIRRALMDGIGCIDLVLRFARYLRFRQRLLLDSHLISFGLDCRPGYQDRHIPSGCGVGVREGDIVNSRPQKCYISWPNQQQRRI